MSAGTYGGQGTDAAFGVDSVNGDHGGHKGSALALLPFEAISHACADGNEQSRVLALVGVWTVGKADTQTGCALPRAAGEQRRVQLYDLEGGAP